MGGVGSGEHLGSGRLDLLGPAVVDVCGGQQADSGVVVLDVIPGEEALAEDAGVLDGTEVVGEGGPEPRTRPLAVAEGNERSSNPL